MRAPEVGCKAVWDALRGHKAVHQEFRLMGATSLTLKNTFVESFLVESRKNFHKLIHRLKPGVKNRVRAIRRKGVWALWDAHCAGF